MSIPPPTVPAVKAYLFAALKARPELALPVLVSYDEPGPHQPDDIVAVCDVDDTATVMRMVGSGAAGWLDETMTVQVVCESYRGGDEAQAVFERAAVLAAVVCDVVRLDPQLGGIAIEAKPSRISYASQWEPDHKGRLCRATVSVSVYASI